MTHWVQNDLKLILYVLFVLFENPDVSYETIRKTPLTWNTCKGATDNDKSNKLENMKKENR